MRKVTILIVDDHAMVREALSSVLSREESFDVIGHCGSREEALSLIQQKLPLVILMDVNMQPVSGFQLAEEILGKNPRQKIIGISSTALPVYAKKMMKLGAKGYVSKSSSHHELEEAVLTVANGYTYLSDDIRRQLEESEINTQDDKDNLSVRELEIIREIATGSSSREIADRLGISLKTVEVHRHNVMKKTGAKNTAALVLFMIAQGLQ